MKSNSVQWGRICTLLPLLFPPLLISDWSRGRRQHDESPQDLSRTHTNTLHPHTNRSATQQVQTNRSPKCEGHGGRQSARKTHMHTLTHVHIHTRTANVWGTFWKQPNLEKHWNFLGLSFVRLLELGRCHHDAEAKPQQECVNIFPPLEVKFCPSSAPKQAGSLQVPSAASKQGYHGCDKQFCGQCQVGSKPNIFLCSGWSCRIVSIF